MLLEHVKNTKNTIFFFYWSGSLKGEFCVNHLAHLSLINRMVLTLRTYLNLRTEKEQRRQKVLIKSDFGSWCCNVVDK